MNGKDKRFWQYLDAHAIWSNARDAALPQTCVAPIVWEHLTSADGGKRKKALIIGYDGCRADAAALLVGKEGAKSAMPYGALGKLLSDGGRLYLSYCGGEKGAATQQHTSTAPGWVTVLTGKWGVETGVTDNAMRKPLEPKTVLYRAAEQLGATAAFIEQWPEHFELTYRAEIDALAANPQVPMRYLQCYGDRDMHGKALALYRGDDAPDVAICVYEATDAAGHASGFSLQNPDYVRAAAEIDRYACELIETIERRATYDREDWLILIASDHGGDRTWHGRQTQAERTTFLACNRAVDARCFSRGYDGLKLRG